MIDPNFNHKEDRQIPTPHNISSTPQNCQGHKEQRKCEDMFQLREAWDTMNNAWILGEIL